MEEDGSLNFEAEILKDQILLPKSVACLKKEYSQILYVADTGNNQVVRYSVSRDPGGPLWVWERFKNALLIDDVSTAVSCFDSTSSDRYQVILEALRPSFQDIVNDMKEMVFISTDKDNDKAYYDLLRQEGDDVFGYPIVFDRAIDGEWKINSF